jgi:hypothetical protein
LDKLVDSPPQFGKIQASDYKIVQRILQPLLRKRHILKIFDLLRGGQGRRVEGEPPVNKEERSYDQLMNELMAWNIEHTGILEILRKEIGEERLARWSDALEKGIRKNLDSKFGRQKDNPYFPVYLDLYKFVRSLRTKLLGDPAMEQAKPLERSDSLVVCIICGIRALQKEKGATRLMDTLQWMVLERYLG